MNTLLRLWLVCAVLFLLIGVAATTATRAQNDTQATIEALQTQVSGLETMVALQTEVATLSTQVSSQPAIAAASPAQVTGISTPTPSPGPGTVLYEADWSAGLNKWVGSDNWNAVDGMLVSSGGTNGWYTIRAPFNTSPTTNYAVEAEIQYVRSLPGFCAAFGLLGRDEGNAGIRAGIINLYCASGPRAFVMSGDDQIADVSFDPGTDWHTYRLEVKGNTIRFFVDDVLVLETTDNRYLHGGRVGLFCGAVANVRSFKVVAL